MAWNLLRTCIVYIMINNLPLEILLVKKGSIIELQLTFQKNLNFALEAHVHVFIKRWALRHSDMSLWNIRDQPFLKEKDIEDQKKFPNNCTCGFVTQHLWKEIEVWNQRLTSNLCTEIVHFIHQGHHRAIHFNYQTNAMTSGIIKSFQWIQFIS